MNYLVTGATGFIGRKLVGHLLAGGHSVNYLSRRRNPTMDSRAAFFCWNPGEPPPLNAVPRLDAIVHLAGEPVAQRWTAEVKKRIITSRVDATRKLVDAIRELKYKPAVLVSASAVGYYGDRGEQILTEQSAPGTGFLAGVCVEWEREAMRAAGSGVRVVPVRIATVLGREGGALPKMLLPFRFGLGARLGAGRQWMPWIHVDDLVELLVFAATSPNVVGPLNGASPQPVTNADLTSALARAVHRPAFLSAPRFALRLALGEMSDVLFQSQRVLPAAVESAGFRFAYPRLEQALEQLQLR
jgi:hypothetical protein